MKLYWSPRSPYVRKVMAVAIDVGIDARIVRVRAVADSQAPNEKLLQLNPWGKIPTFETDDGTILYDSDVICDYLEERAGQGLASRRGGIDRWKTLAWRAFGNEMLDALIVWRHERAREPALRSAKLIAAFELKSRTAFDWLEARAAGLQSLDYRVAQVPLACALGYMDFRYADHDWRSGRPALSAWFKAVQATAPLARTAPLDDSASPAAGDVETL